MRKAIKILMFLMLSLVFYGISAALEKLVWLEFDNLFQ